MSIIPSTISAHYVISYNSHINTNVNELITPLYRPQETEVLRG